MCFYDNPYVLKVLTFYLLFDSNGVSTGVSNTFRSSLTIVSVLTICKAKIDGGPSASALKDA